MESDKINDASGGFSVPGQFERSGADGVVISGNASPVRGAEMVISGAGSIPALGDSTAATPVQQAEATTPATPPIPTGTLRKDIEIIKPGPHGKFSMIFDPVADAYYKVGPRAVAIVGRLENNMLIDDFVQKLNDQGLDAKREEVVQILAFLQQSNLMEPEYGQAERKVAQYQKMQQNTMLLRFSAAYLFFKLPPWRPDKFLNKAKPHFDWLCSRWFVTLLAIPAVIGYVLAARDFSRVSTTFVDSLSWAGLAKYFVAILAMKFVHEAAHSIVATHFNCRVRGIGVGFMVFYPRLYTDTTDSWRLSRRKRLLIDGAGIIAELLSGGIAALFFIYLPQGAMQSTMFYIFAVSTMSTLLVNGNPCIRYDGYYLLCDILNIENLMTRSSEHLKNAWRYYFLKIGVKPESEKGLFLIFFGICTFIYRIFLYTSIILIIYNKFVKALAVVMMFLELYSILIYPAYREIKAVCALSKKTANRARFYMAGGIIIMILIILSIPMQWNTSLPGEVVPVRKSLIVLQESGYLANAMPPYPIKVKKGDAIVEMNSPQLEFALQKIKSEANLDLAQYDLLRLDRSTLGASLVAKKKLDSDIIGISEIGRRLERLTIKSPQSGVFIPMMRELSVGANLNRGMVVGQVVSAQKVVYAYASDQDIRRFEIGQKAYVKFNKSLKEYPGSVSRIDLVSARLHNSPLLQLYGGPIPVYIDERQPDSFHSVQALYQLEIVMDQPLAEQFGRIVAVEITTRRSLGSEIIRFGYSVFRREF